MKISTEKEIVINRFKTCKIEASYKVFSKKILLRGADGIGLLTKIFLPEANGPFPVVVMRTCYPKEDNYYLAKAEEFARRGIAFVYQYCRGVGGSEGVWEPNVNEREDGMTLMNWLSEQSWCQSIGYWGCSYLAFNGWIIADIVPEKVKTMYLTHYGTFRHVSAYKDGLFRQDVLTSWTMGNAGIEIHSDYLESAKHRPQLTVDTDMWGKKLEWYRKWITSPDANDEYWNKGLWGLMKEIPTKVNFPVFIGEGWYDHHLGSAIETYYALPEETKKKSVFLIGAWDHGFNIKLDGDAGIGSAFENNDDVRAFMWFYKILIQGEEPKGEIRSYVVGKDVWHSNCDFSLNEKSKLRFYLGDKGSNGIHELLPTKQKEEKSRSYIYDPNNPLLSHGAESLFHTASSQGSLLQPPPDYRNDVLSFVSAPLENSIIIRGKIKLYLTVSSSAEDTSFCMKISEVSEDGRAYNIRNGITTLAYRNNAVEHLTYTPNEKVNICIESWEVCWMLGEGSRLRVDISSSNFPEFSLHCNKAGIWALQDSCIPANQTIYYGQDNIGYLEIPVIE